jgi:hypothetical protein
LRFRFHGLDTASHLVSVFIAVVICCATRVTEPPRTLDELKAFVANALVVDKPVPEWVFGIFDELSVVEDSMTLSRVQLRKISKISEPLDVVYDRLTNQPCCHTFVTIKLVVFRTT